MVTRELIGTEAEVFTVNVVTEEGKAETVTVKGRYKTEQNLLKAIQKQYDTADVKYMKIIKMTPVRKLFGMPVKQFYENAVELNPETRKPLSE